MFGLEKSYRGITNAFSTQYKNLNTYKINENGFAEPLGFDCFKDGFFIPENVIIIGTMNDIDRSVEAFDFALRRRFRWIDVSVNSELKPALKAMKINDVKLAERITELNNYISGEEGKKLGLNEYYQIGHAYFSEYSNSEDGTINEKSLKDIWNHSIKPLLEEYCRGRNSESFIEGCEKRLLLDTTSNSEQ